MEISIVNNETEFLEHTQIISLLKDQMEHIGSPKTNQQLIETIRLAFKSENAKLLVMNDIGHVIGFCFFNVCIGMESAGYYVWLNEMHIHKQYRSRGYGAMLFEALEKWCKENNVIRIMGMMDESEVRTSKFYESRDAKLYNQTIFNKKL